MDAQPVPGFVKLCREWLAVYDQLLEVAGYTGYQSVRHFHNLYQSLVDRSNALAGEAAAYGLASELLSRLPPRLPYPTRCSKKERAALDDAAALVRVFVTAAAPEVAQYTGPANEAKQAAAAGENGQNSSGSTNDKTTRTPHFSSPGGRVLLFDQRTQPVVCGRKKRVLSAAQYKVVRALLQAGADGLKLAVLKKASPGCRNVLEKLSEDDDWKSCIKRPGRGGGGYRIE